MSSSLPLLLPEDSRVTGASARPVRPTRRRLRITGALGWGVTTIAAAQAALQVADLERVPVPALQAVAPVLHLMLVPVLLWTLGQRRRWRAALVAGLLVSHLGWLVTALPTPPAAAAAPAAGSLQQLRVFSANLNQGNGATAGTARQIAAADPDVVLLLEWSPQTSAPVLASGVLGRYPHHLEYLDVRGSDGVAMFTRLPVQDAALPVLGGRHVVSALLGPPGSQVRFVGVHTNSPVSTRKAASWRAELAGLPALVSGERAPLVLAGDFNATSGHPPFVALLDTLRLTDAHDAVGAHWTATWPAGRARVPAIVRPDHVLVGRGVEVRKAWAGDSSGSDHRPVLAELTVSRR